MRFLATLRPSAFVAGRNSRRVESARQTLFISLVCVHCRRWAGVNRGVNKTVAFERDFLVVCRTRDSLLTYFISFFSLFCERISHCREACIQFFVPSIDKLLIVERKEKSWEKKNFWPILYFQSQISRHTFIYFKKTLSILYSPSVSNIPFSVL